MTWSRSISMSSFIHKRATESRQYFFMLDRKCVFTNLRALIDCLPHAVVTRGVAKMRSRVSVVGYVLNFLVVLIALGTLPEP